MRIGIGLIAVCCLVSTAAQAENPACVSWTTQAPYRAYGYDHIVTIRNQCQRALQCKVTTNANPQATEVTVEPNNSTDVVTFRGSPARVFTATVSCI